jgi:hypothetical protein
MIMKTLIATVAVMMLMNFSPRMAEPKVTVDRIEDNNIAVVEVCYQKHHKMMDLETTDFNFKIEEGDKVPAVTTTGEFEWLDGDDWYQFRSYDNTVWWALTTKDIGFIPEENTTYTLIYSENGTTDCTECDEELNCDCEIHDDIFFAVVK